MANFHSIDQIKVERLYDSILVFLYPKGAHQREETYAYGMVVGTIISVGKPRIMYHGLLSSVKPKHGDRVLMKSGFGDIIKIHGAVYSIIHEADIIAFID